VEQHYKRLLEHQTAVQPSKRQKLEEWRKQQLIPLIKEEISIWNRTILAKEKEIHQYKEKIQILRDRLT
jgi:hypothetical protein